MKPNSVTFELDSQALLTLQESRGARVQCLQGALWLTEEDARRDIVLEAGQSFELTGAGRAVIQAIGTSRVSVDSAAGRPELAFPAAHPALRVA